MYSERMAHLLLEEWANQSLPRSKERPPMLVQLHWQSRANPEQTEFVAQGKFSLGDDFQAWLQELLERHKGEMPDGYCPMVCDETSHHFVLAPKQAEAAP